MGNLGNDDDLTSAFCSRCKASRLALWTLGDILISNDVDDDGCSGLGAYDLTWLGPCLIVMFCKLGSPGGSCRMKLGGAVIDNMLVEFCKESLPAWGWNGMTLNCELLVKDELFGSSGFEDCPNQFRSDDAIARTYG